MLKKIVSFILLTFSFSLFAQDEINECCIIEYEEIHSSQERIKDLLHDHGIIAIRGVPGYLQTYENYIEEARKFVALSDEAKKCCISSNSFSRGWSFGIEKFKGKLDTFKASYYVKVPEDGENLWPQSKEFKKAYLTLANIIFETGKELLPEIGLDLKDVSGLARMLFYAPVGTENNDGNPNWCSEHRDHSVITGLCAATFVKDGNIISKPENCGLYVRGESVSFPKDLLIFQIGETAQLMSNGRLTATDHLVKKSLENCERFTMALFFDCDMDTPIFSTVTEYNDRFTQGMTYREWSTASFNKYKSS
jgi:isopenicillin N synthase-like dioxygenase